MTSINKNNYEAFFLDYIEGSLDAEQISALMLFVEDHPELKEELQGLEMIKLKPDTQIRFGEKKLLKKPVVNAVGQINENNYQEFLAAASENDLNESDSKNLQQFLRSNPDLQKEYELILLCRLQPDASIVFADKDLLKKTPLISLPLKRLYYGMAIAASLALLIGLGLLFDPAPDVQEIRPQMKPFMVEQLPEPKTQLPVGSGKNVSTTVVRKEITKESPEMAAPLHKSYQNEREILALNRLATIPAHERLKVTRNKREPMNKRVYFSNNYTNITIAQNIRHAEIIPDENVVQKLLAQGSAVVKEIFRPEDNNIRIRTDALDLWKIADAGINGFARLTDSDLEFRKKKDDDGNVVAFALESQSMHINRNLRKNKQ
jgi:hypothetical protein